MTLTQQRRYDKLAFNLLIYGSLLSLPINYFLKQGFWRADLSRGGMVGLALASLFLLWQAYCIKQGQRWAKLLYIILTVGSFVLLLFTYKHLFATRLTSPALIANFIGQTLLSLWVLALTILSLRRPTPEPVQD